jgi:hypothetical protein
MSRGPFAGYSSADEERPLAAYAVLTAVYNALLGGFLFWLHRRGRELPERVALRDILLLGVATHKLSRLLAKDWVTSFARAPFTTYQGAAAEAEVVEEPRGSGLRLAMGELVT